MKKQRQDVSDFRITVEGERVQEEETKRKPFRKIHVHFQLAGAALDRDKVVKAVALSMEKYCSATAQLEALAEITTEVSVTTE